MVESPLPENSCRDGDDEEGSVGDGDGDGDGVTGPLASIPSTDMDLPPATQTHNAEYNLHSLKRVVSTICANYNRVATQYNGQVQYRARDATGTVGRQHAIISIE
jgi:hypothetical protein